MLWTALLKHLTSTINPDANLPARLVFWNGEQLDLGEHASPRVILRVNSINALPYLAVPSLDGLGDAYVKGLIDLEGSVKDVIKLGNSLVAYTHVSRARLNQLRRRLRNAWRSDRAAIRQHYDVSNDFYQLWLDPDMVYSCAYFECGSEDLATAQHRKIDHILTKVKLEPEQRLLDVGCGWGALVMRAATQYGARCVGVTLSQRQYELALQRVRAAGLADRIEIRLQDFRQVEGEFDRITSVGMFEHVGRRNLNTYFQHIHDLLAPDGLALNHGITSTDPYERVAASDGSEFIDKYVFPKGELPHVGLVLHAMQCGGLEALDVENLRRHYARTLECWVSRFEEHGAEIQQVVDAATYRIWRIYLAGCAYAFQHDQLAIYQVLCQRAGRDANTISWSRRYMYE